MEAPAAVRSCLWSYDIDALDIERNKDRIITNVLNFGTKAATDWLFTTYSKEAIAAIVREPLPGEWDAKSLNLWSLVFGVIPQPRARFQGSHALRYIG